MADALGRTVSEKILAARSGSDARPGDFIVCNVDLAIGTDGSGPLAIDYFHAMGGTDVHDPSRTVFSRDHYAPPASLGSARLHGRMSSFARRTGVRLLDVGEGISFEVAAEQGLVRPGALVVGADSHTVTCGALNAFAIGVGSSDLAVALRCGTVWLRVPETVRIELTGALGPGALAKDAVLELVGRLGPDGANYRAIEFDGPGVATLGLGERMVLSNMSVELGAKAALFPVDTATIEYLASRMPGPLEPVHADSDASYAEVVTLDLGLVAPRVAVPHAPHRVVPAGDLADTPVQYVFIGTCTGGRPEDFRETLHWIRMFGGRIHTDVQLVLTPASREALLDLQEDGTLAELVRMGGILTTAGCGPCCGTSGPIPADDANVLSTANRNFKGRMGNPKASIYLASPAVCGASAATGQITDPRNVRA